MNLKLQPTGFIYIKCNICGEMIFGDENALSCITCGQRYCFHCDSFYGEDEKHECNGVDVKSIDYLKSNYQKCYCCGAWLERNGGCMNLTCNCNNGKFRSKYNFFINLIDYYKIYNKRLDTMSKETQIDVDAYKNKIDEICDEYNDTIEILREFNNRLKIYNYIDYDGE